MSYATEKIYDDDQIVPYKTTKITALGSRSDIDGLLAKWGVKKTGWDWSPEEDRIILIFNLPEKFGDNTPAVRFEPPKIWTKAKRNHSEEINWAVSMRCLHWSLKAFLETAYLMQYSKSVVFMPWLVGSSGKLLMDILLPQLRNQGQLPEFAVPSNPTAEETKDERIIDA
jgi:hypothetical protein